MELSTQAQTLINKLKEFDEKEFYQWFLRQKIGTSHVFQYLEWKEGQNGNIKN